MATIIQLVDTLKGGGVETVCLCLAENFHRLGYKSIVVYLDGCNRNIAPDGVELLSAASLRTGTRDRDPKSLAQELLLLLQNKVKVKEVVGFLFHLGNSEAAGRELLRMPLFNNSPSRTVLHAPISITRAELFNPPKIRQFLEFWRISRILKKKHVAKDAFLKAHLNHGFICVSPGIEIEFRKLLNTSARITTIPNPIDFKKISNANNNGRYVAKKHILHVGRMTEEKNQKDILLSYARSKVPLPLVMLGDGPLMKDLINFTQKLGLRDKVHFPGYTQDTLPYYYGSIATLLTSKFEGLGMCLIESLACGVPVLSYACPTGPVDLLSIESPESLVPFGDVEELANKLNQVWQGSLNPRLPNLAKFNAETVAQLYLSELFSLTAK